MKRPYPTLSETIMPQYINKLAFVRKFVRYWGVTTVEGVRVLTPKKYYYKSMDDSTVKLAKLMGMYSELANQRMKGVSSAWLYLNPNKASTLDFSSSIISENIQKAVGEGISLGIVIGPKITSVSSKKYASRGITGVPVNSSVENQAAIIDEIDREYTSYWDNGYIVRSSTPYDKYKDILAKYILTTNEVPYTITKVNKTYTSVDVPYTVYHYDDGSETFYERVRAVAYEVIVDIPTYNFTEYTDIVQKIKSDGNHPNPFAYGSNDNLRFMYSTLRKNTSSYYEEGDEEDTVYTEFAFSGDNLLWYRPTTQPTYGDTVRYLREDALVGGVLTLDQKVELIGSIIDGDYKEKSREVWETLLVMVVIVVSIVLAIPSGGTSLAAGSAILAAAAIITTAAFYITIAMAIASSAGMDGVAAGLNRFLKDVAPLVKIATVIAIFGSIKNLAKAGMGASAKEAGKELAADFVVEVTMENVVAGIEAQFADIANASFSDLAMDHGVKIANMAFDAYQKNELDSLQDAIKNEKSKLAEYAEAKEGMETRNLMLDMMRIQFNPLGVQHSYYDKIYDKPYERWATEYHIGNMCATTVNALWTDKA